MLRRRNILKNVAFQVILEVRREQSKPMLGSILTKLKELKTDALQVEMIADLKEQYKPGKHYNRVASEWLTNRMYTSLTDVLD